jgi:hypothetical protein
MLKSIPTNIHAWKVFDVDPLLLLDFLFDFLLAIAKLTVIVTIDCTACFCNYDC